jgi:hypothetical protein
MKQSWDDCGLDHSEAAKKQEERYKPSTESVKQSVRA